MAVDRVSVSRVLIISRKIKNIPQRSRRRRVQESECSPLGYPHFFQPRSLRPWPRDLGTRNSEGVEWVSIPLLASLRWLVALLTTFLLAHSHSLAHLLTYSLTYLLTYLLPYLPVHSLTRSLAWLIRGAESCRLFKYLSTCTCVTRCTAACCAVYAVSNLCCCILVASYLPLVKAARWIRNSKFK